MPEEMSERMSAHMPEIMSEDMPKRMSEDTPERMSEDMICQKECQKKCPKRLSGDMPERMPIFFSIHARQIVGLKCHGGDRLKQGIFSRMHFLGKLVETC